MSKRKTPERPLVSNKQRSALRRAAIDRLLAAGHPAETIAAQFAKEPLAELIDGMPNAPAALHREIKQVLAARALDPRATAQADNIADLRHQITLAEAALETATGSEHRLRQDQIARFRKDLADAQGHAEPLHVRHSPRLDERRKPDPAPRAPEDQPTPRPPTDWEAKRGRYDTSDLDPPEPDGD